MTSSQSSCFFLRLLFDAYLDSDILRSFIYKMISVSPTEVVYCVAGTKNYSDIEFSDNRRKFLKLRPIYGGTYFNRKYDKTMDYKVIII